MKLNVKIEDQTFEVEIADLQARPVLAVVDGETFEVWPEEAAAPAAAPASVPVECAPAPMRQAAASATPAAETSKAVTAPIPGVIIAVIAKPGDSVKVGQELCTLEAMKMKNAIRATREGKIATVRVSQGDHVKHGQVLFEFTD